MSGEGISDQRRTHAGHFVGRNASTYTAAADGQSPGNFTFRHSSGKRHHKIRVVISFNQFMGAEVLHLITGSLEVSNQLHFQLKPAMVRSNANAHYFSSILSSFSFYVPSGLHFQSLISGMSWPCLSMY